MKPWSIHYLAKWKSLLRETTPSPEQIAMRLRAVERDIVLPVKAVAVGFLFYYFFFTQWFEDPEIPRSVAQAAVERFFFIYLVLNVAVALSLVFSRRLPSPFMEGVIFTNSFVDGLFMAALTFVTGGFDSILYWVFLGLIVRNALSVPLAVPQIILNLSISACYFTAGLMDVAIDSEWFGLEADGVDELNPTEPFLLRLIVLWLMTACCYGVQVLFEKQRKTVEEFQETSIREGRIKSAGRLAAEIAHQLKNPLGIINNAAWSLQRAVQDGRPPKLQQVQIIREEVERSDRILTQLMGYAQLAEGRVERLLFPEVLEAAIQRVFPEGGAFRVQLRRDLDPDLPPLIMQRPHLMEVLVNILQNAREALQGQGVVEVSARHVPGPAVKITIRDDGPGVDPKVLPRLFTPYFTTKEKGTGLGLAIARNHVEMYSGTIRAESRLGKGAAFIIELPTRTILRKSP